MHFLIEALGARLGGGITRLFGILEALPKVAPQHRFSILLSPAYQSELIAAVPSAVTVVAAAVPSPALVRRAWFQNAVLPRLAREIGADAIFAASEGAYLRAPVPTVMMCGNLLLFPTVRKRMGGVYAAVRRPFLIRSFRVVRKVAFVSEAMRDVAMADLSFPPERTVVVYHGVDRRFRPQPAPTAEPYYLAVSSIAEHKGYDTLLDAWSLLPPSFPRLRIAGAVMDRRTDDAMRSQLERAGLAARVDLLGGVAFERLPELYASARGLVFPSEVESFGLPLVEAMASGVPVIASDLPVCREICGDAAIYVPRRDSRELARQLVMLDANDAERERLRAAGLARAERFSWQSAAAALVGELEQAARSGTS